MLASCRISKAGEPLGGTESLLGVVSFKKATESVDRGRVVNAR